MYGRRHFQNNNNAHVSYTNAQTHTHTSIGANAVSHTLTRTHSLTLMIYSPHANLLILFTHSFPRHRDATHNARFGTINAARLFHTALESCIGVCSTSERTRDKRVHTHANTHHTHTFTKYTLALRVSAWFRNQIATEPADTRGIL